MLDLTPHHGHQHVDIDEAPRTRRKRVFGKDNQIGELSGPEAADVVLHEQCVRAVDRHHAQRLCGGDRFGSQPGRRTADAAVVRVDLSLRHQFEKIIFGIVSYFHLIEGIFELKKTHFFSLVLKKRSIIPNLSS